MSILSTSYNFFFINLYSNSKLICKANSRKGKREQNVKFFPVTITPLQMFAVLYIYAKVRVAVCSGGSEPDFVCLLIMYK